MAIPLISVLIPVYNCQDVLEQSVQCILNQTLGDFEIILLDDGSRDGSRAVMETLARRDARIRLAWQENQGVGGALNRALDLARGKYYARMDADDLTPVFRFAHQVEFLEAHPEITVLSGWYRTFGAVEPRVHELPTDPGHAKAVMLFRCPICHANAMVRGEAFRQHGWRYVVHRQIPEDYDLWVRMARHHEFANLPEVLLDYRIWPGCSGQHRLAESEARNVAIQCQLLAYLGLEPSAEERAVHQALAFDRIARDPAFLRAAHAWLRKIAAYNEQAAFFCPAGLARALTGRYIALVKAAAAVGRPVYDELIESPFRPNVQIPLPTPSE